MTVPDLSVVVIGHRNERTLEDAVASVVAAAAEHAVEVVVATSGSGSGVDQVRARFPQVRTEHSTERLLPGAARNVGIRCTEGRHVAFLEGDCLASPGWVERRLAAHREGRIAVAGSVGLAGPRTPWGLAAWLLSYHHRLPGLSSGVVEASDPRAHGLSIRRDVIEAAGHFDTRLRIGEDTLMAVAIGTAGHEIWFAPDVTTEIRSPGGPAALVIDEFRRGHRQAEAQPELEARGLPRLAAPSWHAVRRSVGLAGRLGQQAGGVTGAELRRVRPFLFAGALARAAGRKTSRLS